MNEWRRSSFCSKGGCVYVARDGDHIHIADHPDGTAMRFSIDEWTAFVAGVKAGEFDTAQTTPDGHHAPGDVVESARRLATDNGDRAAEDLEVVLDYVLGRAE
jgi:hypothetical protein